MYIFCFAWIFANLHVCIFVQLFQYHLIKILYFLPSITFATLSKGYLLYLSGFIYWLSILFCWNVSFCQSHILFSSVQFSSVAQSYPTLCDPMNHSTPGFPNHRRLPESTQTHVRWVGDAIQPSQPLMTPSPPALNLSQH